MNPDCTGTKIGKTYDSSGNLINTAYQDFVLVDDANEIFEIFTSNIRNDGVALPTDDNRAVAKDAYPELRSAFTDPATYLANLIGWEKAFWKWIAEGR